MTYIRDVRGPGATYIPEMEQSNFIQSPENKSILLNGLTCKGNTALVKKIKEENKFKNFQAICNSDKNCKVLIIGKIVDGGYEKVYKSEWTDLGIKVIIKGLKNAIIITILHPQTVLVHQGKFIITDFGIYRYIKDLSSLSEIEGVAAYIEPQALKGLTYTLTQESDIYSLEASVVLEYMNKFLFNNSICEPLEIDNNLKEILIERKYPVSWIPFNKFQIIEQIGKRKFTTIKTYLDICYKNLSFLHCYGISRHDISKDYIIVIEYAEIGSLQQNLNTIIQMEWKDKFSLLKCIISELQIIYSQELIHHFVKNSPKPYIALMKLCCEKESVKHPSALKICKLFTNWEYLGLAIKDRREYIKSLYKESDMALRTTNDGEFIKSFYQEPDIVLRTAKDENEFIKSIYQGK
ncbi:hypothetical protein C2G38_2180553 [Gigaspora rosea]|uniref:Protein kinase domain-containing protein n=1 Tax=Gigaspora rosea TaxID=44941 RepID=A0A397VG14_9GLOM|nr:hypothetical protein C2G38_2180553 [Gigaspora rosea]